MNMHSPTKAKRKTKYEVFHSNMEIFWDVLRWEMNGIGFREIRKMFEAGQYTHVHTFELARTDGLDDALEEVFISSQGGNDYWDENTDKSIRSTSVGDLVRVGREYWLVASVGYKLCWKEERRKTTHTLRLPTKSEKTKSARGP